jgi:hypothetical protein
MWMTPDINGEATSSTRPSYQRRVRGIDRVHHACGALRPSLCSNSHARNRASRIARSPGRSRTFIFTAHRVQKRFVYVRCPHFNDQSLAQAMFREFDRCPPKAKVTRSHRIGRANFSILQNSNSASIERVSNLEENRCRISIAWQLEPPRHWRARARRRSCWRCYRPRPRSRWRRNQAQGCATDGAAMQIRQLACRSQRRPTPLTPPPVPANSFAEYAPEPCGDRSHRGSRAAYPRPPASIPPRDITQRRWH